MEAVSRLNLSYGSDARQVYDLYLPQGRSLDTKVIILLHGGSWVSGSKEDVNFIKDIITSELKDYAVVNMNYRLARPGVSPFPTQTDDITSLVNHLKAKRNEYMISNELAFVGVSAGAHLAMFWSYTLDTENQVNAVVSIVGPTDLSNNDETTFLGQIVTSAGVDPTEEFFKSNSPVFQATPDSPPTIQFHGGLDELVDRNQGVSLRDKLNELGVENEYTLYPFAMHDYSSEDLLIFDTWLKTRDFILKHH
ncbi:alpha/beta hydrolase [uncultured Tenacibaculum sp.]|uniref:alpha/beta hydrolase n=1 Tax=uncultured Tenacibaculum sp. TaxID=174713 RepID=UPI003436889C